MTAMSIKPRALRSDYVRLIPIWIYLFR